MRGALITILPTWIALVAIIGTVRLVFAEPVMVIVAGAIAAGMAALAVALDWMDERT